MESTKCACGNDRMAKERVCLSCHAAYMRNWRKTHKLKGEARKKDITRHYTNVYVKRGKIKKTQCEVCGEKKVQAHHLDYKKPLLVIWLCKPHHKFIHQTQEGA